MQPNQVLLVCSTPGHLRHLEEIGSAIEESGLANVSLLHFPRKYHAGASSKLKEYVFQVELEAQAVVPTSRAKSNGWRTALHVFMVTTAVQFLRVLLNRPLFYLLLSWQLVSTFKSYFSERNHSAWLRSAILNVWRIEQNLMDMFPLPAGYGSGRVTMVLLNEIFFGLWRERQLRKELEDLMARVCPQVLILPELNWGYSHALLIEWSRKNKVPILTIPYTLAGRREWVASFAHNEDCWVTGVLKRLVAIAFPEWVLERNGRRLMLPLEWLVSCESAKFSPNIPWVTNSGPNILVAADSPFTLGFYQREGVDTSCWSVIGSMADDRMHTAFAARDALRSELAGNYRLCIERRWVLIALPPNQFDCVNTDGLPYSDYQSLLRGMVGGVVAEGGGQWDVLINLHPRTKRTDVDWLESLGAVIVAQPVESLLPLSDLFIASASATIRWAVACGVPTINYDAYHYKYDDYQSCPGVVEVDTPSSYREVLTQVLGQSETWLNLKRTQEREAHRLFCLDGYARPRLLSIMRELLAATS